MDLDSLLQKFHLNLPDLGSATTWKIFLVDPQTKVQAFLYPANRATPTAVPQEFIKAIALAFQQSPAARALKADLTTFLETLFSFVEFLYALSFGGFSAPGEFGVSYCLLPAAPFSV
jgi:hypothetical protein